MEPATQIQYSLENTSVTYIGTVIDTTTTKLIVAPIADTTGTPLTTTIPHQIPRDPDLYRVIASPNNAF